MQGTYANICSWTTQSDENIIKLVVTLVLFYPAGVMLDVRVSVKFRFV